MAGHIRNHPEPSDSPYGFHRPCSWRQGNASFRQTLAISSMARSGILTVAGVPFRQGYLLHGFPGLGKLSLRVIHTIAGKLALGIYFVSLSSSYILTALMGRVPT
ncbi:putative transmembrane protein, partial [Rhizoctonia solani 123E]